MKKLILLKELCEFLNMNEDIAMTKIDQNRLEHNKGDQYLPVCYVSGITNTVNETYLLDITQVINLIESMYDLSKTNSLKNYFKITDEIVKIHNKTRKIPKSLINRLDECKELEKEFGINEIIHKYYSHFDLELLDSTSNKMGFSVISEEEYKKFHLKVYISLYPWLKRYRVYY